MGRARFYYPQGLDYLLGAGSCKMSRLATAHAEPQVYVALTFGGGQSAVWAQDAANGGQCRLRMDGERSLEW